MAQSQVDWSELPWRKNEAVAHYRGINNSNVHLYFMISPFFDPTSNNGALDTQARYQANLYAVMADRHLLEARLRSMSGMEFMVVEQPPDGKEMENPIWVINKQDRQKRQGQEDEVTVLGTYYVVGENVWQAPSVENVLMTKLLSITSALTSFFSLASSLPLYSPALGHHYLSPSAISSAKKAAGTDSRAQSPDPASHRDSVAPPGAGGGKTSQETDAAEDFRLLGESLHLTAAYGSEYMDENPLHGEPGNFVFASSKEHLKAQQQAQQAKEAAAAAAAASTASNRSSGTGTPIPEIKTQGLEQLRKGSKGSEKSPLSAGAPKLRRKKTGKGAIQSPGNTSPT